MSDVTIIRFAGRPEAADGLEWYGIDDQPGSMLFAREAHALDTLAERAGGGVDTWSGRLVLATGEERRGAAAYHLRFPVPDDFVVEFDAWYRCEHAPMLLEEPTWYACELFRATSPAPHSFAVIHYLEPEARQGEAVRRSIRTPWWNRLAANNWWDSGFERLMLQPL